MSFDDWYKVSKWHPHLMTLDYGSIVVMVEEYAEAYAQSLQPTPSSVLEASTFTDTNGEKCCSACCKPLIVSSVPEAEGLVEMAANIVARFDSYCGLDGSDPYEGDDCPHEYVGLGLLEQFRAALALYRRQHPARKDGRG